MIYKKFCALPIWTNKLCICVLLSGTCSKWRRYYFVSVHTCIIHALQICQAENINPSNTFTTANGSEQIIIDPSDRRGQMYLRYTGPGSRYVQYTIGVTYILYLLYSWCNVKVEGDFQYTLGIYVLYCAPLNLYVVVVQDTWDILGAT